MPGGSLNIDGIIDEIAFTAYAALLDRVKKAQVNKVLEILESTQDVMLTSVFVARQHGRNQWGDRGLNYSAWRLVKVLEGSRNLAEARRRLVLFKWFFEAGEDKVGRLRGVLRRYEGQLRQRGEAPPGFSKEFLKAVLSIG